MTKNATYLFGETQLQINRNGFREIININKKIERVLKLLFFCKILLIFLYKNYL